MKTLLARYVAICISTRRTIPAIALGVLFLASTTAKPYHHPPQLLSVTGASTVDANRHYLLHAANSAGTNATDPLSVNAVAFKNWFMNAIEAFNAIQTTRTNGVDEANAMTAFISERDAQVAYYMGKATARLTEQEKQSLYAYIEKTRGSMTSGVEAVNCSQPPMLPICSATFSSTEWAKSYFGPGKSENFRRSNGELGPHWTSLIGSFSITGDVAYPAVGSQAYAYYNAYEPTADQIGTTTLADSVPLGYAAPSPCVRMSTSFGNFYCAFAEYDSTNGYQITLSKNVSGATTNLQTWKAPTAFAVGDIIMLRAIGSLISVFYDGGKVIDQIDTSLTSGYVGMGTARPSGSTGVSAFSSYSDGATVSYNNILEGQGLMQVGHGKPLHTPGVSITVSGRKNTVNGPGVCAACYFYAEGTFDVEFEPGQNIEISQNGQLVCSVIGMVGIH